MALFKCKMCGGSLEIQNSDSVAMCEYCGTQQTIPKTNDNVIANLFNRANNLRLKCEFDKAAQIYEKIIEQDDSEAEAHWGLVLCKYGIEYIEDPKTSKRVPTCHRTLFEAVTTDADYIATIDYSDAAQQQVYEREARTIDKIQKDILAIVKDEKPFDVFICYKEADENGKRTVDSTIANEIYYQLTQEGFKVFFAAITLEDKLGSAYEPYIFAALNSSMVMVALGTKPEYFNAVWVKNEWSRFMRLMKANRSKLLIPCYRDMDAYDLPEEFAHLQALDMSKLGFMQDLIRGIKKIIRMDKPVTKVEVNADKSKAVVLAKRAAIFLEDDNVESADDYCEKALDIDPECAEAYLIKLMIDLGVRTRSQLKECRRPFDNNTNYQRVIRFGDDGLKTEIDECLVCIRTRIEQAKMERIYSGSVAQMSSATSEGDFLRLAKEFESIADYKDACTLAEQCRKKAETARYELELRAEIARQNDKRRAKRNRTIAIITIFAIVACVVFSFLWRLVVSPMIQYNKAETLLDSGSYDEAIAIFAELESYRDSDDRVKEIKYTKAGTLSESGDYAEAANIYKELGEYEDSATLYPKAILGYATELVEKKDLADAKIQLKILENYVSYAESTNALYVRIMDTYYAKGRYNEALSAYAKTKDYSEDSEKYKDMTYKYAQSLFEQKNYSEAKSKFKTIFGYSDADEKAIECDYQRGLYELSKKNYKAAVDAFSSVKDYSDSEEQIKEAKYQYVNANKIRTDSFTYNYLQDLKTIEYKDSAEIFKELYAWKVDIIVNDDEENSTEDMTSVSKYYNWYFHLKLTGGEPGATVKLKYTGHFPNGSEYSDEWDEDWADEYSGTCWFWYDNPEYGKQGKFTLKVYDSADNLLGEKTVKITR